MDKDILRKNSVLHWRTLLCFGFQCSYRHQRAAFRLYQALAEREVLAYRRELLLIFARNAEKSAATYAIRLLHLNVTVPQDLDTWSKRLWYWLLVHSKSQWVIAWIEWQQHKDARFYIRLFQMYSILSPALKHR